MSAPTFGIVIPARYPSSRYPGKPLALLTGAGGEAKPLIRRAWEAACAVPGAAGVWVATDDDRIATAVRGFGGQVVMTSDTCRNGTERCAEALAGLPAGLDIVVNLQGDAPLTPSFIVTDLVAALAADPGAAMATAGLRCSASTYDHLVADQAQGRVGGTTVVVNRLGHALYFSKRVIPYVPTGLANGHEAVRLHLGLYAYRPDALRAYAAAEPSPLEDLEGLEQLRFLEGEAPVRVVSFDPVGWDCIELNNPGDVPAIEAVLKARGIA
ncbi:MAG: 3-deoxy-manno-octulosonate cytidylyltransferase [Sphingomonadales bacterium]|nr:3-deoxy-manno-octulosonate cytidylyltransferase [Sphingomonadales bacterium]